MKSTVVATKQTQREVHTGGNEVHNGGNEDATADNETVDSRKNKRASLQLVATEPAVSSNNEEAQDHRSGNESQE